MPRRALFLFVVVLLAAVPPLAAEDEPAKHDLRDRPRPIDAEAHGVGQQVPDLAFTYLGGKKGVLADFKKSKLLVIALTPKVSTRPAMKPGMASYSPWYCALNQTSQITLTAKPPSMPDSTPYQVMRL